MSRFRVICVLTVMSLTGGLMAARSVPQQPADFSGGWMAVKDAPAGLAAPSPVFGARFWIKQEGQTVTITRPLRDTAVIATHVVGGPDVRSRVPGAQCLGDATVFTRLDWEGAALVHRSVSQMGPGVRQPVPAGLRHVFKVTSPDTIVVESTMRTSAQSTELTPVGTVYRKMTDPAPAVAPPVAPPAPALLEQMSWLAGTWSVSNATTTIEERWTPASGGSMLGVSRTSRNPSVTAFEFLCIAERHGGLVYTAMPNARTPTDFQLTAIDDTSATFENPSHDFPKKIRYALRPDGALEAVISGAATQKPVTFVFKKQ
jgi:hypothetical protein